MGEEGASLLSSIIIFPFMSRDPLSSLKPSNPPFLFHSSLQASKDSQQLQNAPSRIPSKMPRYYLIRLATTPQDQLSQDTT